MTKSTPMVTVDSAFFALCDVSDASGYHDGLRVICVERDLAVATNGHIVAALSHAIKWDKAGPFAPFCVLATDIERIGKSLGKSKKCVRVHAPDGDGKVRIEPEDGGATFTIQSQDIRFPDWRRCVNNRHEPKGCGMIGLNSDYLARFSRIVGSRNGWRGYEDNPHNLTLRFNGDSSVVWVTHTHCDGFFGAIMPVRLERSVETEPGREDALRAKWLEPEASAEAVA